MDFHANETIRGSNIILPCKRTVIGLLSFCQKRRCCWAWTPAIKLHSSSTLKFGHAPCPPVFCRTSISRTVRLYSRQRLLDVGGLEAEKDVVEGHQRSKSCSSCYTTATTSWNDDLKEPLGGAMEKYMLWWHSMYCTGLPSDSVGCLQCRENGRHRSTLLPRGMPPTENWPQPCPARLSRSEDALADTNSTCQILWYHRPSLPEITPSFKIINYKPSRRSFGIL